MEPSALIKKIISSVNAKLDLEEKSAQKVGHIILNIFCLTPTNLLIMLYELYN